MLVMLGYNAYYKRRFFFPIQRHICHFDRPGIKEVMNLRSIFSLLFFEHGYLSYYLHYSPKIVCVDS